MNSYLVNIVKLILLSIAMLICNTCISEYEADIKEENELLVVEGIITDQNETYTVKISTSLPLGLRSEARPLSGCAVTVTDNYDFRTRFNETEAGTYVSPEGFIGQTGRSYKINIVAPSETGSLNYESTPALLWPVNPITRLYYEKVKIRDVEQDQFDEEGCQIYLDSEDPGYNTTKFRWEYFETWILRLPFSVPNQICWLSDHSREILIKSSSGRYSTIVTRLPVKYISNSTDRLKTRYSILVNQYSVNNEEYEFWRSLKALTEETGGLYDIIPYTIPGNLRCLENPEEVVLGYFSVSGKSSQRLYIDENFAGIFDPYTDCITDTIYGDVSIPRLDTAVWVLFDKPMSFPSPRTRILTDNHGCYDCTDRGTTERPSYWTDE